VLALLHDTKEKCSCVARFSFCLIPSSLLSECAALKESMYNSAYETLRKCCDLTSTFSVEKILSIDEIKDIAVSPWSGKFATHEDHPLSAHAHNACHSAILFASSSFKQCWQWHMNPYLDNNIPNS
jgi:hypothetical protein